MTMGMGGLGGGLGSSGSTKGLKGTGMKEITTQNFSPEQMKLFQSLFGHLGPNSFLSRLAGGDEGMFEQMEAPAWKQFGEAQGQLGSRFSQLQPGAMGAQNSSGFKNTAGQMGSDFAQQLQANRMGLQHQALQDLMGMSNDLLGQRPFETNLMAKKKPFWQELLGGMMPGIGTGIGMMGGGAGAGWLKKLIGG